MAARGEAQADVEVSTLVVPAWRLRWRAPELALVLGERAVALASTRRDEVDRLRAEALVVFASNRMGRGVRIADRALDALKAAEAASERETAWRLRVELADSARSVGAPLTGFAAVRPVLEAEDVPPGLRATALVQASECLVSVGRGAALARALDEADGLYQADPLLDHDTTLLHRGLLRASAAGQHRRWGDLRAAEAAARDGLALLDRLKEPASDNGQVRGRLTVELVCALMDLNKPGEASEVGTPLLERPVRAPSAATAGWLRLALATRVHLPAGRVDQARDLLRDAADSAERHQLDTLLAESLLALAHVHEVAGDLAEALANLRSAHAAERRRARAVYAVRARLAAEFAGVHRQPAGGGLHDELAALLRDGGAPTATPPADPNLAPEVKQQLRQWRPVQMHRNEGVRVKRSRRAAEDMTVEGISAARAHAADRWRLVQPFGETETDREPGGRRRAPEPTPETPGTGVLGSAGAATQGRPEHARSGQARPLAAPTPAPDPTSPPPAATAMPPADTTPTTTTPTTTTPTTTTPTTTTPTTTTPTTTTPTTTTPTTTAAPTSGTTPAGSAVPTESAAEPGTGVAAADTAVPPGTAGLVGIPGLAGLAGIGGSGRAGGALGDPVAAGTAATVDSLSTSNAPNPNAPNPPAASAAAPPAATPSAATPSAPTTPTVPAPAAAPGGASDSGSSQSAEGESTTPAASTTPATPTTSASSTAPTGAHAREARQLPEPAAPLVGGWPPHSAAGARPASSDVPGQGTPGDTAHGEGTQRFSAVAGGPTSPGDAVTEPPAASLGDVTFSAGEASAASVGDVAVPTGEASFAEAASPVGESSPASAGGAVSAGRAVAAGGASGAAVAPGAAVDGAAGGAVSAGEAAGLGDGVADGSERSVPAAGLIAAAGAVRSGRRRAAREAEEGERSPGDSGSDPNVLDALKAAGLLDPQRAGGRRRAPEADDEAPARPEPEPDAVQWRVEPPPRLRGEEPTPPVDMFDSPTMVQPVVRDDVPPTGLGAAFVKGPVIPTARVPEPPDFPLPPVLDFPMALSDFTAAEPESRPVFPPDDVVSTPTPQTATPTAQTVTGGQETVTAGPESASDDPVGETSPAGAERAPAPPFRPTGFLGAADVEADHDDEPEPDAGTRVEATTVPEITPEPAPGTASRPPAEDLPKEPFVTAVVVGGRTIDLPARVEPDAPTSDSPSATRASRRHKSDLSLAELLAEALVAYEDARREDEAAGRVDEDTVPIPPVGNPPPESDAETTAPIQRVDPTSRFDTWTLPES
ncbi:hypothetical protein ACFXGA_04215 [Actinosynnema sp. NPDC059335]|uniref:hypothetical protein n=1 Tax=Actinosynnema sp. NPDC059335 TaxID=3346804 RepID=UPI003671C4E4